MIAVATALASSKRIRQKRSQKTYDALIQTTFKLLQQREFDEISIAELAQKAGYSVGAFYARFRSKDELFDALLAQHIEDRFAARKRIFDSASDETLVAALMEDLVDYYWTRRRFWRAALVRSIKDPKFWKPVREQGLEFGDWLIERISARAGRGLTEPEQAHVRFALQLALGTINNTIINRPGPIFMEQVLFIEQLTRAFRLVSGYDELTATREPPRRGARGNTARPGR
jgi:AcrR family transcriptional regulator